MAREAELDEVVASRLEHFAGDVALVNPETVDRLVGADGGVLSDAGVLSTPSI